MEKLQHSRFVGESQMQTQQNTGGANAPDLLYYFRIPRFDVSTFESTVFYTHTMYGTLWNGCCVLEERSSSRAIRLKKIFRYFDLGCDCGSIEAMER